MKRIQMPQYSWDDFANILNPDAHITAIYGNFIVLLNDKGVVQVLRGINPVDIFWWGHKWAIIQYCESKYRTPIFDFWRILEQPTYVKISFYATYLPYVFLLGALLIMFMMAIWLNGSSQYNYPTLATVVPIWAIQVMAGLIILLGNIKNMSFHYFHFHFYTSELGIFIQILVAVMMLLIFGLALNYNKTEQMRGYEFSIILLFGVVGMMLLLIANDFLTFYLALELQSFSFYILAAYKSWDKVSTEAGLKYFLLGALSTSLLLFGISLIYGFTGVWVLSDLKFILPYCTENYQIVGIWMGIVFILVSLLFKLGVSPFHQWVPDVYEGAPTIVTALFALIQKLIILTVTVRFYHLLFYFAETHVKFILTGCIFFSLMIGSLGAINQTKIKRLLAYSAIVNGGFLLIGLGMGTPGGFAVMYIYLIIYIIALFIVFSLLLGLRNQSNLQKIKNLADFIYLKDSNIVAAVSFSVALFSLAGIPPMAGFFSKFFLLVGLVEQDRLGLAIFAILMTVITTFYYIRLVKIIFFEKQDSYIFFSQVPKWHAGIISYTVLFTLFFFIYPHVLVFPITNLLLSYLG